MGRVRQPGAKGVSAFLVGEAFMRAPDPGAARRLEFRFPTDPWPAYA
jgi:indole-3-glycerol phosphate synthase